MNTRRAFTRLVTAVCWLVWLLVLAALSGRAMASEAGLSVILNDTAKDDVYIAGSCTVPLWEGNLIQIECSPFNHIPNGIPRGISDRLPEVYTVIYNGATFTHCHEVFSWNGYASDNWDLSFDCGYADYGILADGFEEAEQ